MIEDPLQLKEDLLRVVELAGINRESVKLTVESLPAPHKPPSKLAKGKMAVYVFSYQGQALKVGKAGPKSQARYASQHYNPGSAPSTLAASLLKESVLINVSGLTQGNVSEWIRANTDRLNVIIDESSGVRLLTLLESFLQCKLRPLFEGFASQR